jgi:hypothetical protein
MVVKEGLDMSRETCYDKFKRLAEIRVNRFKNLMLLISNLSDSRYDYTEEEAVYYYSELKGRIEAVKNEFYQSRSKKSELEIEDFKPLHPLDSDKFSSEMNMKFHKLMVGRLNRIAPLLRLLVNLTNRSHYDFRSADVKQIFNYMNKVNDTTLSHFVGIGDFSFSNQMEEEQEDLRRERRG